MDSPSTSMLRYATRVGAVLDARDDAASDDAASAAEATIIASDAAAKARERALNMMKIRSAIGPMPHWLLQIWPCRFALQRSNLQP
jgi:hypothetical protein